MENDGARRDLLVRTKEFARRVIRLYSALPSDVLCQTLGRQVLRSGTSVGANYREANAARSKAEFLAKMGDCLKELSETEYWFELMTDEKVITPTRMAPLLNENRELIAIFTTIIRKGRVK